TNEAESGEIEPILIDTYVGLNRFDDAFSDSAAYLAKHPDAVSVLISLAIVGTEQAKQKNAKYVKQSHDYGMKAIEMFEADHKPEGIDAAAWARYKTRLPELYQEMAIISLMQQNTAEEQTNLEKAIKLNPAEPFNYVLQSSITNDEYQR